MNRISNCLKSKRKTQNWLSDQIGISRTSISTWCNNKIQPSLDILCRIASVLDIEVFELIEPTKSLTLTLERLKASEAWNVWVTTGDKREIVLIHNIFFTTSPASWVVVSKHYESFIPWYSITRFCRSLFNNEIKTYYDHSKISTDVLIILLLEEYSCKFN